MTIIRRQATGEHLIIEGPGFAVQVRSDLLDGYSEAQIKLAVEGAAGRDFDDLWVHRNRDGTLALAVGGEPEIWPEDEVDLESEKP